MRKVAMGVVPLILLASPVMAAKAVKVVEPLAAGVVGQVTVVATAVTIGDTARSNVDKLDVKATRRAPTGGASPDPGAAPASPDAAGYKALPLTAMLPMEIADATRKWGLTGGRPVRLAITLDTLKTDSVGAALLIGTTDQIAGMVDVLDAGTGERLGEFYVDVIKAGGGGPLGLALRGSGIREKLAAKFAQHVAEQLGGGKHKPKT